MVQTVRQAIKYFGGEVDTKTITGTSYTIVEKDLQMVLWFTSNSPVSVTLPDFATIAIRAGFTCRIIQAGDGVVTILPEGGDSVVTDLRNIITAGKGTGFSLLKESDTTWWVVAQGDTPHDGILSKLDATVDPIATDDSASGYTRGSKWYNQTTDEVFECMDASVGAAVWITTSLTFDELGSAALSDSTDFATAAQGFKADSAIQPSDNVSELTNDAGYVVNTSLGTAASEDAGTGGNQLPTNDEIDAKYRSIILAGL